jgi:hypothetical protein
MQAIYTISDFLQQSGNRFRIFDLGRRIVEVPVNDFLAFEKLERPWPYPLQRHAWLGITFWQSPEQSGQTSAQEAEQAIWFLRLPLDEQAKLMQVARDGFLRRLLEIAGAKLDPDTPEPPNIMEDNPLVFRPREDRLAVFNARAAKALGLPASKYYQHARDYLQGEMGFDQWAFVGLQGLADFAMRLDEADNAAVLDKAIAGLPEEVLIPLCHALENVSLPGNVLKALQARLQGEPSLALQAAVCRGVSFADTAQRHQILLQLLDGKQGNEVELLAAIAARAWDSLNDEQTCLLFLERLAENSHGQEVFNEMLADLMFIPGMREPLFAGLRNPKRSEKLSQAIDGLFAALQSN